MPIHKKIGDALTFNVFDFDEGGGGFDPLAPITGAFDVLEEVLGINKQIDDLVQAGRIVEAQQLEALKQAKQLFEEGKPLREALVEAGVQSIPGFNEAALESLGLIREDVKREPGTGPLFQTGLRRGTKSIFQTLAPFGLTESSVAGEAVGQLTEGLIARDIARIEDARFRTAGFAPRSTGQGSLGAATGLFGQASALTQVQAGLRAERNAPSTQFRTGLFDRYLDIGETLVGAGVLGG